MSGFQGQLLAQKQLQPPDFILPLTLSDLYLSTSPELQKNSPEFIETQLCPKPHFAMQKVNKELGNCSM